VKIQTFIFFFKYGFPFFAVNYLADIFSEHFDVSKFEQVFFELFNFVVIIKGLSL